MIIYAGSIVINAKIRPIDIGKMKKQAMVMSMIVFVIMLVVLNY